jgi:L-amino acid N-acyltransferase YncA
MKYQIERLSERHRKPVIDIFNYFINSGFAAYPEMEMDYGFFDRMLEMVRGYPALAVKNEEDKVVGFGLLRSYHFASTFKRTAEISYYLLPDFTRLGIGKRMLEMFEKEGKELGIESLLASISSRNNESIQFHQKNGFRECGRFQRIGNKFNEDFDVVWMQKFI